MTPTSKIVGLREQTAWFANEMEQTLIKNDHKTGWDNCSLKWLLGRLKREVGELEKAISRKKNIVQEATDVANFAMMIADNFTNEECHDL